MLLISGTIHMYVNVQMLWDLGWSLLISHVPVYFFFLSNCPYSNFAVGKYQQLIIVVNASTNQIVD